ncbi:hypothetical protein WJX74_006097 [Apatococcus lobatus]|uniref:Uncharacterized protein n=1 Tax=Apatococcus lobatus TaxID=904363 RepID=A0AAW1RLU7_9CHLO
MFASLLKRELTGQPVRSMPWLGDFSSTGPGTASICVNPSGSNAPPFSVKYNSRFFDGKLLAVSDEEGFISILDASVYAALPESLNTDDPVKPRAQWLNSKNAVFDVAWTGGDSCLLAASGDQTIRAWNVIDAKRLTTFAGHTASVKSVAPSPHHPCVFASGGRDGAMLVWDFRAGERQVRDLHDSWAVAPVISIQDAHFPSAEKRRAAKQQIKHTVTSVLFLQHDAALLSAGAGDGTVKYWDMRMLSERGPAGAFEEPEAKAAKRASRSVASIATATEGGRSHGVTCLSLSPQGDRLLVSSSNEAHYLYNPLKPGSAATASYTGHACSSFYVKACFSPDGSHILSGSSNKNMYIWQVDDPDAGPFELEGHEGEVTCVDWCRQDMAHLASVADDSTVRVWQINRPWPHQSQRRLPRQSSARGILPVSAEVVAPMEQAALAQENSPLMAAQADSPYQATLERSPMQEATPGTTCTAAAQARDLRSPLSELPVQLERMNFSAGRTVLEASSLHNAMAEADTGMPSPAVASIAAHHAASSSSMQTPAAPASGTTAKRKSAASMQRSILDFVTPVNGSSGPHKARRLSSCHLRSPGTVLNQPGSVTDPDAENSAPDTALTAAFGSSPAANVKPNPPATASQLGPLLSSDAAAQDMLPTAAYDVPPAAVSVPHAKSETGRTAAISVPLVGAGNAGAPENCKLSCILSSDGLHASNTERAIPQKSDSRPMESRPVPGLPAEPFTNSMSQYPSPASLDASTADRSPALKSGHMPTAAGQTPVMPAASLPSSMCHVPSSGQQNARDEEGQSSEELRHVPIAAGQALGIPVGPPPSCLDCDGHLQSLPASNAGGPAPEESGSMPNVLGPAPSMPAVPEAPSQVIYDDKENEAPAVRLISAGSPTATPRRPLSGLTSPARRSAAKRKLTALASGPSDPSCKLPSPSRPAASVPTHSHGLPHSSPPCGGAAQGRMPVSDTRQAQGLPDLDPPCSTSCSTQPGASSPMKAQPLHSLAHHPAPGSTAQPSIVHAAGMPYAHMCGRPAADQAEDSRGDHQQIQHNLQAAASHSPSGVHDPYLEVDSQPDQGPHAVHPMSAESIAATDVMDAEGRHQSSGRSIQYDSRQMPGTSAQQVAELARQPLDSQNDLSISAAAVAAGRAAAEHATQQPMGGAVICISGHDVPATKQDSVPDAENVPPSFPASASPTNFSHSSPDANLNPAGIAGSAPSANASSNEPNRHSSEEDAPPNSNSLPEAAREEVDWPVPRQAVQGAALPREAGSQVRFELGSKQLGRLAMQIPMLTPVIPIPAAQGLIETRPIAAVGCPSGLGRPPRPPTQQPKPASTAPADPPHEHDAFDKQQLPPVDRSCPHRKPLQELDRALFSCGFGSEDAAPLKSPAGKLGLQSPPHASPRAGIQRPAGRSPPRGAKPHAGLLHSPLRSPLRKPAAGTTEFIRKHSLSSPLGQSLQLAATGGLLAEQPSNAEGGDQFVIHSPLRNRDGTRLARPNMARMLASPSQAAAPVMVANNGIGTL